MATTASVGSSKALRTALSGKQTTPGGGVELLHILGKEESLRRMRRGIEKLSETLGE